jgi:hypothetical protein
MVNAFEGDTAETATMLPTIRAFTKAHQLPDVTIVADAGMISAADQYAIEAAQSSFILGARIADVPCLVAAWRCLAARFRSSTIRTVRNGAAHFAGLAIGLRARRRRSPRGPGRRRRPDHLDPAAPWRHEGALLGSLRGHVAAGRVGR